MALVSDRMCHDSVYISSGTAARHPSLFHLPSQCHATAVRFALLLLTVPDCCLLGLACAPSAGGPKFTLGQSLQIWSLNLISARLGVLCSLKQVRIPSGERMRRMDSERVECTG